ncbi:enoyl-CoA hydratase/isomerase family protein [Pedobacter lithocola]|uniref:Enoyl-CoA hydratase/isomerase family protein n=1 Tax=Pedobacter lithocola TaxID=1908239 RepID=A0ABV8P3M5_9SPHI
MTQIFKTDYSQMTYNTFQVAQTGSVIEVTFDNGEVNVLSGLMIKELTKFLKEIAKEQSIRVIVFQSANPYFFIAHVDINILEEKEILEELGLAAPENINLFQAVGEMLRNQPQVTIVKLKGIARGGGAEFATAADMCFASKETGKLAQCEALMGIIPGGGATQYLSSKMSRARVLEIILGGDLMDADTAERYGWINRSLPEKKIDSFVDALAQNIASLPEGVTEVLKRVLPPSMNVEGFKSENDGWAELAFNPRTAQIMKSAMEEGAQTISGELRLEALLRSIK